MADSQSLLKSIKMKFTPVFIGLFAAIPVCKSSPFFDGKHPSSHKIVVEDVLQTTSYTYLQFKENDSLKWLAIPSMQATKGQTYYYSDGLPMKQFESKELHRTFDEVLFLGGVSPVPITDGKAKMPADDTHAGISQQGGNQGYVRKATPDIRKDIKIDVPKDCITIAELFSKKEQYAGKTVKIKGQVTKFSAEIMNKNWIHMQDGTEDHGKFDLVITSPGVVKLGDEIEVEGKVSVKKDFGYGYFFDVMMEDANVK